MNATIWVDAVGWALLHFVWQGIAAGIALWVALAVVKSPVIRYRLSTAMFFLLPLLPLATAIQLAGGAIGLTNPAPKIAQESLPVPHVTAVSSAPAIMLPMDGRKPNDRIVWVVILWAVGAIAFGSINFMGWLKVRQMVRVGVVPARDIWTGPAGRISGRIGIRRVVRLLESTVVNTPAVIGHFRPVILLPISLASGLPPGQIEMILAHELAHIRRCDFLVNLAQGAVETVLFYHPVVWWISGQVRREREACCDEIAVKICGGDSIAYARTLADLEEWRSIPRPAVAATSAPIVARVHRLLGLRDPRGPAPTAAIVAGFIACIALPLAATRLRASGATEAAPEATTAVHILGADGRPASGARVAIMRHSETGEDEAVVETAADAGGVAFVPAKSLADVQGNPRFVVAADGSGVTVQRVSAGDGNPTVRMSRADSITATFLGPDGKPVPGLTVEPNFVISSTHPENLSIASYATIPPSLKHTLSQRTDANGKITFTGFSLEQRVHLEIPDERFATLEVMTDDLTLSQTGNTPEKTVRLLPAAKVIGVVRFGSTGKPAVGMTVSAQGVEGSGWGSAVTDDHGRYELRQLRAARYDIALDLAKAGLDKDWTAVAYDSLPVAAGEQIDGKDFALIPGVVVRGSAVDAKSGAPIVGAQIGIYGPAHPKSGAWVQSATSDATGAFKARVPAGTQYIYPMSNVDGQVGPPSQEPMAVEGQALIVRLAYSPNLSDPPVVGHVVRADGTPAAGATVLADRPGSMEAGIPQAVTDATGQFRFSALADGTLLRARLGDSNTAAAVKIGAQNRGNITMKLATGSRIALTVQVIRADGTPIPNAKVELCADMLGPSAADEQPTDARGNYTFSELYQDQPYDLVVTMEGFNAYQATLHPKPSRRLKQLRKITLLPATGTITGSVIKDSAPRGGVRVELQGHGGWQTWQTTTDAAGRFHFDHVDLTESAMIRAVADWGTSAWQSVGKSESDVRISFDP